MPQGASNVPVSSSPPRKQVLTVGGSQPQVLQALRRQLQAWEGDRPRHDELPVSTGCAALDRLLPAGGLVRGSLVEWRAREPGSGAGTLALLAAREACYEGGALVVCDVGGGFYPPAAAALGIDLAQVVLVRPAHEADAWWALEQALRCPAVAAVWAWLPSLPAQEGRRLQLAAETGGTLGLWALPAGERGEPTWANVQWQVEPQPSATGRQWRVELAKARGGSEGKAVSVELDPVTGVLNAARDGYETCAVPAVSSLAIATGPGRPARTAR